MRSLAFAVLLVVTATSGLQGQGRPNIVFMFSDDLTTQAISAYEYGLDLPKTPNIDRLAAQGMLFQNSFCGNSICTPSRGTVMTGLHSHKNGIVHPAALSIPAGPPGRRRSRRAATRRRSSASGT